MQDLTDFLHEAQRYAQERADAAIIAWHEAHPAVLLLNALDVRALIERRGFEVALAARQADPDHWRYEVDRVSRVYASELLNAMWAAHVADREEKRRRGGPRRGAGGAAAEPDVDAAELSVMAGRLVYGVFGWLSLHDREDLIQGAVTVALDRITRLYDPARGPYRAYAVATIRGFFMAERQGRATRVKYTETRESEAEYSDGRASAELERVIDRLHDIGLVSEIDEWASEPGNVEPAERKAYFARRAGGEPGDAAERKSFCNAARKIRGAFPEIARAA
jgi:hypothetical protein